MTSFRSYARAGQALRLPNDLAFTFRCRLAKDCRETFLGERQQQRRSLTRLIWNVDC